MTPYRRAGAIAPTARPRSRGGYRSSSPAAQPAQRSAWWPADHRSPGLRDCRAARRFRFCVARVPIPTATERVVREQRGFEGDWEERLYGELGRSSRWPARMPRRCSVSWPAARCCARTMSHREMQAIVAVTRHSSRTGAGSPTRQAGGRGGAGRCGQRCSACWRWWSSGWLRIWERTQLVHRPRCADHTGAHSGSAATRHGALLRVERRIDDFGHRPAGHDRSATLVLGDGSGAGEPLCQAVGPTPAGRGTPERRLAARAREAATRAGAVAGGGPAASPRASCRAPPGQTGS